ncbi:hypothetical protein XENOCAPTIV_013521 [Xenoophorus captivus]|uniref:Uncharacterized protein n=1 Tax=Xenoophorus captivus TaxID=1517983 RepID=A0ABV0QVG0_9TELE
MNVGWSAAALCYASFPLRNRVEMVYNCAVTLEMSLENVFSMPKKREVQRKGSVIHANTKQGSHDNMAAPACEGNADQESDIMQDQEDTISGPCRDNLLVQQVTDNIAKILDAKLENVIKPVTERSENFDSIMERPETVEQRMSDLEDTAAVNDTKINAMETALKKALERMDNYENQSRRQNVRIL